MWLYLLLVAGLVVCSIQVVRSQLLISAVLWLAGASALTSMALYNLGAPEVAVIELSVGAGLVTVLFVFAIAITGEHTHDMPRAVPAPIVWTLSLAGLVLLAWYLWPAEPLHGQTNAESGFVAAFWEQRGADVWVQIILILAGVLGILNLLAVEHGAERTADREKSAEPHLPALDSASAAPLLLHCNKHKHKRSPQPTHHEVEKVP